MAPRERLRKFPKLSQAFRADEAVKLEQYLKDITKAPSLRRVNGFCLLGTMNDSITAPSILKMYWFTALWIPIFPIGVYLVRGSAGGSYKFLAKMDISTFHSLYRRNLAKFYMGVAAEALLWLVMIIIALSIAGLGLTALIA